MKKLRGICLGAGYFSRFQYEAWARIPEVEIIALANRSLDKARETAALHRIPRAYAWVDLAAMLDAEKPDFVDIITPRDPSRSRPTRRRPRHRDHLPKAHRAHISRVRRARGGGP